jgi:hypothetical protein
VEIIDGEITPTLANEAALRHPLEVAGVKFIDESGGGAAVRLRKPNEAVTRLKIAQPLDTPYGLLAAVATSGSVNLAPLKASRLDA